MFPSPDSHIRDGNKGEEVAYSANHNHCQGVRHEHRPVSQRESIKGIDWAPEFSHMRIVAADVLANAWTSALIILTAMQPEFTLIAPLASLFLTGFTQQTLLLLWTGTVPSSGGIAFSCLFYFEIAELSLSHIY